jgi:equilibrative nucleoside transporter 1/2/3
MRAIALIVINKELIYIAVANGVYQNTVFGMAAKLPFKYTGAVILGTVSVNYTKSELNNCTSFSVGVI